MKCEGKICLVVIGSSIHFTASCSPDERKVIKARLLFPNSLSLLRTGRRETRERRFWERDSLQLSFVGERSL